MHGKSHLPARRLLSHREPKHDRRLFNSADLAMTGSSPMQAPCRCRDCFVPCLGAWPTCPGSCESIEEPGPTGLVQALLTLAVAVFYAIGIAISFMSQ